MIIITENRSLSMVVGLKVCMVASLGFLYDVKFVSQSTFYYL